MLDKIYEKISNIKEYEDIVLENGDIRIVNIDKEGGKRHIIESLNLFLKFSKLIKVTVSTEDFVSAILYHDIEKNQPQLSIGDIVNPKVAFEKSELHAIRSSSYAQKQGFNDIVINIIKYHHSNSSDYAHLDNDIIVAIELFKLIDGLSAGITRRGNIVNITPTEVFEYSPMDKYPPKKYVLARYRKA